MGGFLFEVLWLDGSVCRVVHFFWTVSAEVSCFFEDNVLSWYFLVFGLSLIYKCWWAGFF